MAARWRKSSHRILVMRTILTPWGRDILTTRKRPGPDASRSGRRVQVSEARSEVAGSGKDRHVLSRVFARRKRTPLARPSQGAGSLRRWRALPSERIFVPSADTNFGWPDSLAKTVGRGIAGCGQAPQREGNPAAREKLHLPRMAQLRNGFRSPWPSEPL